MLGKVHIAKKQLGLDGDDYVAVLLRVTGHASSADCSDGELVHLIGEFERLGFWSLPKRPGAGPRPADHPVALKARALWISLHQLGAVDDPSERALEAFARRQLKVERLQWANQAQGYKLIEALKAMAERAGWSQDLIGVPTGASVVTLRRRLVDRLMDLLVAEGVMPTSWSIERAAFEFGGLEIDADAIARAEQLDRVAQVLSRALREGNRR